MAVIAAHLNAGIILVVTVSRWVYNLPLPPPPYTRFKARSKDQEIKRREVELDHQVSPEEIVTREVGWAAKGGLLSLRVVRQQRCNGHCPCDSAQARQCKQRLRSALVAGQWRGDTALTLPLFWRRSTVSPVSFGRYPRSSLHSFTPPPLLRPRP